MIIMPVYERPGYNPAEDPSVTGSPEKGYCRISFKDAVITTGEMNGYHDSDFYAVCWTGKGLTRVTYDTTRFAGGGSADSDISDENWAACQQWVAERLAEIRTKADQEQCREVKVGREVIVARGTSRQKAKRGTQGVCLDMREYMSRYGTWSNGTRVMIGYGTTTPNYTLTLMQDGGALLTSPYREGFGYHARALDSGAKWDKPNKRWIFSKGVDMEALDALCEDQFGVRWEHTVWVNKDNVDVVEPERYLQRPGGYPVEPEKVTAYTCRAFTGRGGYPVM